MLNSERRSAIYSDADRLSDKSILVISTLVETFFNESVFLSLLSVLSGGYCPEAIRGVFGLPATLRFPPPMIRSVSMSYRNRTIPMSSCSGL